MNDNFINTVMVTLIMFLWLTKNLHYTVLKALDLTSCVFPRGKLNGHCVECPVDTLYEYVESFSYQLVVTGFWRHYIKKAKVITDVLKSVLQNIRILVPVESVYRTVRVTRCKEETGNIVEMKTLTMASAMLMIVLCKNLSVTLYNVWLYVLFSPSLTIIAVWLNVLMINRLLSTANVWKSVQNDMF